MVLNCWSVCSNILNILTVSAAILLLPWQYFGYALGNVLKCFYAVSFHYLSSALFFRASMVAQWVKNLPVMACNAGDLGLIPGFGRSIGEENGYPLQYSCLENSMDRGDW